MRIEDITTTNRNLAFRNDVKLSHYRSAGNSQLVENYQFSARSSGQLTSTVELLERLTRTVADGNQDNRFIFQATYGKGKSHFALALANFFGKPADAPETLKILETIEHVTDASRAGSLKDFKSHHKPFITVLMDGVGPGRLRDKFFSALDEALKDHPETAQEVLPFWFSEALNFLDKLNESQAAQAEVFLETRRLDLQGLRDSVAKHEGRYYELCHELFQYLYSTRPDFGSETSLSEALNWAANKLCGKSKPFGGVLVLFDEFSLFVQDYGRQPGGTLQDLLNGIEGNRSKVLFIAFTQQEPETMVPDDGSPGIQSLHKELNRIPRNNRFSLQASLEDVLREFFREDEAAWRNLLGMKGVAPQVSEASDVSFEAFKSYYQRVLGWSNENFHESITKDCFPLHPFTTVLLSSVQLSQAATTRSVIGFLTEEGGGVAQKMEQDALVEGRVNWVLPISLVDYFQGMLGEDVWKQYQGVKAPDLTDQQEAVLKAMVLQRAAEIPTKIIGFEVVIGQLAGLTPSESKEALTTLEAGRYIRRDGANRSYAFWAGSNGAVELERMLSKEMNALRSQQVAHNSNKLTYVLDDVSNNTTKATELLKVEGLVLSHPVSVKWGHPDDWAADEIVLSRAGLTISNLKNLLASTQATTSTYAERRGVVVVLLAEHQHDIEFYENELERILDEAAPLKSAPFAVMQPKNPDPELVKNLLKYAVLNDSKFSINVIPEIGRQVFDEEKFRVKDQLEKGLSRFRAEASITVSQDARGQVRAKTGTYPQGSIRRLEVALNELYDIVYHGAPASFFDQYKHTSSSNLRNAVLSLVPVLEGNNVTNAVLPHKVSKEVVDKFLTRDWGLLNGKSQLQPPTEPRMKVAWDYLDKRFMAGETVSISAVISPLLNTPFGYDYNTLTLLFASWYGHNRRDLELYYSNRVATLEQLTRAGKGNPQDFVKALGSSRLRRRDPDERYQPIKDAIERIESGNLSFEDAQTLVSRLDRFALDDDGSDARLSADAKAAIHKGETAFERLKDYDEIALKIKKGLLGQNTITTFASQIRQIDKLPTLLTVLSTNPSADEIRKNVMTRFREFVNMQCEKNERLTRDTDYGLHKSNLKELQKELERLNLNGLVQRVEQAFASLEAARQGLGENQQIQEVAQIPDKKIGLRALELSKGKLQPYLAKGTERVKDAAQKKLSQIEQEIKELRKFMVDLPALIDKISSHSEARDLSDRVAERRHLYDETTDSADLDEDRKRIKTIERAFALLERPLDTSSAQSLTKQRQALEDFETSSPIVKTKIETRIAEIDKRNEQETNSLLSVLASLDTSENNDNDTVGKVEEKLRGFQRFFAGTDKAASIEAGLKRAETYRNFFRELLDVSHKPPSSPAELAARRRDLEEIQDRYQDSLKDAQISAIHAQLVSLENEQSKCIDKARGWLNERQTQVSSATEAGKLDLRRKSRCRV